MTKTGTYLETIVRETHKPEAEVAALAFVHPRTCPGRGTVYCPRPPDRPLMTSEEREEMRRHFGVLTEDLRSQIQQVAEGVTANGEAIRRSEKHAAREFDAVHRRLDTLDSRMAGFEGFRTETARNFAAIRTEMTSSRPGVPVPKRPRARRRPN
jgi:hypothetical protein